MGERDLVSREHSILQTMEFLADVVSTMVTGFSCDDDMLLGVFGRDEVRDGPQETPEGAIPLVDLAPRSKREMW